MSEEEEYRHVYEFIARANQSIIIISFSSTRFLNFMRAGGDYSLFNMSF